MKDQERSRFPIGQFEYGRRQAAKDVQRNIRILERFPKELRRTLDRLRPQEYDLPYRQGGWTVRQVVHHLADSHMNAYIRMKLAYTETGPRIKAYEETLWAETEDGRTAPLKPSLRILTGLHRRWIIFLESLGDDDFDRGYFHPDLHRTIELSEAVALYAWHAQHHLAHIRLVVDAVESGQALAPGTGKPGRRRAAEAAPVLDKQARRKRRSKEEMERDRAASDGEKKRRGLSPERMAEVRAVRMAKIAERKAAEQALQPAGAAMTAPKRRRRTPEEMERDRAAKAAASGGEKKRRGLSPERMAEVRAVRMARIAERKAAQGAQLPPANTAPKRKRRTPEEMERDRAAKAAAAKGEKKRRGLSPERMAEVRAVRMARIAERRAAEGAQQPPVAAAPKRKRRTPEEMERDRVAKAAASGGEKKRRGLSPERMAEVRAVRMAKIAERKAAEGAQQPAAAAAPKRKRRSSEEVERARAEKAAGTSGGEGKRRGMSPEHMERIRAVRMANIAARKNAEAKNAPAPVERTEMNGEQPAAPARRGRKPNATPVEVTDQANPGQEIDARTTRTRNAGSGRGTKAKSGDDANTTGPATRGRKKKDKG